MYISETDKNDILIQPRHAKMAYLILTVIAVAVAQIYGLFGHGVTSAAMSWMFLYPLLGGFLLYYILGKAPIAVKSVKKYRLFFNLYNSGIAALTAGSLLLGIFEIAGTSSPFTIIFYLVGGAMSLAGLIVLLFRN